MTYYPKYARPMSPEELARLQRQGARLDLAARCSDPNIADDPAVRDERARDWDQEAFRRFKALWRWQQEMAHVGMLNRIGVRAYGEDWVLQEPDWRLQPSDWQLTPPWSLPPGTVENLPPQE